MEQKLVRVPFEVDMAKKITKGEIPGKIVTRNGQSVRIVSFDRKDEYRPLVVLVDDGNMENVYALGIDGKETNGDTIGTNDLMLEIPEYLAYTEGDVIYGEVDNGGRDYWDQIRIQAATAAMQGFLANPSFYADVTGPEIVADKSVQFADELIKKLKEGGNDDQGRGGRTTPDDEGEQPVSERE